MTLCSKCHLETVNDLLVAGVCWYCTPEGQLDSLMKASARAGKELAEDMNKVEASFLKSLKERVGGEPSFSPVDAFIGSLAGTPCMVCKKPAYAGTVVGDRVYCQDHMPGCYAVGESGFQEAIIDSDGRMIDVTHRKALVEEPVSMSFSPVAVPQAQFYVLRLGESWEESGSLHQRLYNWWKDVFEKAGQAAPVLFVHGPDMVLDTPGAKGNFVIHEKLGDYEYRFEAPTAEGVWALLDEHNQRRKQ